MEGGDAKGTGGLEEVPPHMLWALNNEPRVSCSGCYGNSFPAPLSREAKGPAGRPQEGAVQDSQSQPGVHSLEPLSVKWA